MEGRDGDAALASVGVGPDGRQVILRCELAGEWRGGPGRRDTTRLAVEFGREEVLDGVDEELLGLADVRAPALEVVEAGRAQALQGAVNPGARHAEVCFE
jgi:hypothetical protein